MDSLSIIALILGVLGIAGGFLPVLPGPPISGAAMLCLYLSTDADEPISRTALLIWLAAAIALTVLDYVMPGLMTKVAGGHKSGSRGATIGLIIGLFFTPVGMVMGSFLGAFLAEWLAEDQSMGKALKAAAGTFLAFLFSTGLKVIFAVIVMWQLITHIF